MTDRLDKPNSSPLDSPKKGRIPSLIKAIAFFGVLGLIVFFYWLIVLRPLETTDDAYVNGHQIRVTPRTAGTILEILVDNTDDVTAGQLLVRLDPTDATIALAEAKENLAQVTRQVASLNAQRDRLRALIEARQNELAMIQNDYQRRLKLKTGSSITAEEVERYRNQTDVAGANLRAAMAELASTRHLLGEGPIKDHPQVLAAAAKLRQAWLALERCQIRSPVAGRVARRTVQVGSQVAIGNPLLLVAPLDNIWVDANFKESQLAVIKVGQQARIKVDLYNGEVIHKGVVVGRSAGTGSVFSLLPPENATGNWIKVVQRVPIRIALDPQNVRDYPLLLGLSCRVDILLTEPTVTLPPPKPQDPAESVEADFTAIDQEIATIIAANLGRNPRHARDLLTEEPEAPL